MATGIILFDDNKETRDQKRKRLTQELRFLAEQWNSKLTELLETGVNVDVQFSDETLENREALIGLCEVSYQTAPKFY